MFRHPPSLGRELREPIHVFPLSVGAPAGAVDVDQLRHVADGGSPSMMSVMKGWSSIRIPGHTGQGKHCGRGPGFWEQGGEGGLGPGCGWGLPELCPGGRLEVQPHTVG